MPLKEGLRKLSLSPDGKNQSIATEREKDITLLFLRSVTVIEQTVAHDQFLLSPPSLAEDLFPSLLTGLSLGVALVEFCWRKREGEEEEHNETSPLEDVLKETEALLQQSLSHLVCLVPHAGNLRSLDSLTSLQCVPMLPTERATYLAVCQA